jgi:hypothetical protein
VIPDITSIIIPRLSQARKFEVLCGGVFIFKNLKYPRGSKILDIKLLLTLHSPVRYCSRILFRQRLAAILAGLQPG